jgi:hypothetical protein
VFTRSDGSGIGNPDALIAMMSAIDQQEGFSCPEESFPDNRRAPVAKTKFVWRGRPRLRNLDRSTNPKVTAYPDSVEKLRRKPQ